MSATRFSDIVRTDRTCSRTWTDRWPALGIPSSWLGRPGVPATWAAFTDSVAGALPEALSAELGTAQGPALRRMAASLTWPASADFAGILHVCAEVHLQPMLAVGRSHAWRVHWRLGCWVPGRLPATVLARGRADTHLWTDAAPGE